MEKLLVRRSGFALRDETGRMMGYLDQYGVTGDRAFVTGWTCSEQVSFFVGDHQVLGVPHLPRRDVPDMFGLGHSDVGFYLDQPWREGRMVLSVRDDDRRYFYEVPALDAAQVRRARRALLGPFLRKAVRSSPFALRWVISRDPALRGEIKRRLGLATGGGGGLSLAQSLFPAAGAAAESLPELQETRITIVLPVYNAFEMLPDVLDRVLRHTDLPWHLVVVEDASPDERVRPWLRDWIADREEGRVTLIENPENRGFIRSVNSAFSVARERGDHVILLNSDAFVPENWASRLVRPLLMYPDVATVTPMSNDAEIFSVPQICLKNDLAPGEADVLDTLARRFDPNAGLVEAPTGVGFCMAVSARFLAGLGDFDTAFGRGYGEEVDWCQRAREAGGRHLGLPALFVEHRGGSSFGSEAKLQLVQDNNARISRRYPDYDAEVQDFIRRDPLATARLALAVALAAQRAQAPVPIYLAHSMGGGAERYLVRRIEEDLSVVGAAVVLRIGGSHRWQVELLLPEASLGVAADDFDVVAELLEPLSERHLVYSCGVGDSNPVELPRRLLDLWRSGRDRIEVLLHDYLPLSPSYCLLDADGWFRGVPEPVGADRAHCARRADGHRIDLGEWRAAWGALMEKSDTIVVFSDDSHSHVAEAYPEAASKIVVRPHKLLVQVPRIARPSKAQRRTVGVLGAIGYQKGAALLADLSRALGTVPEAGLVLVGELDPAYSLAPPAHVHGRYDVEELPDLVERYGITEWLIPSVWPETFSFATHEALATGLPVYCFDLGAQAEAVKRASNGYVIPMQDTPGALVRVLLDTLFTTDPQRKEAHLAAVE